LHGDKEARRRKEEGKGKKDPNILGMSTGILARKGSSGRGKGREAVWYSLFESTWKERGRKGESHFL